MCTTNPSALDLQLSVLSEGTTNPSALDLQLSVLSEGKSNHGHKGLEPTPQSETPELESGALTAMSKFS